MCDNPPVRTPNFLVVGVARAGTTAVVAGLSRHPRVAVTSPKEPHYFALHDTVPAFTAPGDDVMINNSAITTEADYLALFPAGNFEASGDGSTSTFYYHQHAIPEILRMNPDMKCVVMLREPVERSLSAYQYLVSRGYESWPDLLDAIKAEPGRIERGYHHLWHYEAMSHYAESLLAFRDALGPNNLRVAFQEDLRHDPASVLVPLLRFIGTTPAPGEGDPLEEVNNAGSPRHKLISSAVALLGRRAKARAFVKSVTTWETRERLRRSLFRQRTGVDYRLRKELGPRFAAERAQLRTLVSGITVNEQLPEWLASD